MSAIGAWRERPRLRLPPLFLAAWIETPMLETP